MNWNYRVVSGIFETTGRKFFVIKEVHYNERKGICGISTNPIFPAGDSFESLRRDFKLMQRAFKKPVINEQEEILDEWDDDAQGN